MWQKPSTNILCIRWKSNSPNFKLDKIEIDCKVSLIAVVLIQIRPSRPPITASFYSSLFSFIILSVCYIASIYCYVCQMHKDIIYSTVSCALNLVKREIGNGWADISLFYWISQRVYVNGRSLKRAVSREIYVMCMWIANRCREEQIQSLPIGIWCKKNWENILKIRNNSSLFFFHISLHWLYH